jgi:thiol-disulfide isomerase/thioredoxin
MRRRTLLLSGAWAAAAAPAGLAHAEPAAPGQRVAWPDVTLLDGTTFGAAQAEGRAVVAVFWSIGCPFCRRHNPHVEKLHRAARAAGRPLTVLGIARDRDAAAVRAHARERGYTFPITLDATPLAAALSRRNLIPLTVTVDRRGLLRQVIPGEMFEEDVMELLGLAA